jgi:lipoprotein-anchoring transpeptidase ErfK/SrfK
MADLTAGRIWQIAALTAAGVIGSASHADAALYYWQDNDPGFYRPVQPMPQRRHRARRAIDKKKTVAAPKDTGAKPVSPLIISISIEKQRVRIYDANGFFAEAPVSTGMKGHPTPMGVFSIIQKHKLHHSNIYSNAPMPYMQRITWSGVAMHAGVLPGYPASHGCIRMPMAFAQKMWNWTKMGARVIVTPGEITPARFSHPLLMAQKVVPVASEAPQVDAPLGVKSDKGADASPVAKAVDTAEVSLELRSTVGHGPLTQTADASSAMPANAAVTMSDASPAGASGEATTAKAAETADAEANPETAKSDEAKPETAKFDVEPTPAKSADTASTEEKPDDIVTGDVKPPETTAIDSSAAKAEASVKAEKTAELGTAAKAEATAEVAKTEAPKPEAAKPETAKANEPKLGEKPVEARAADAPASPPDVKKDPARLPGIEKAAKAEPKREGQVAVFISRKDGKLYMRQSFKPVFEVPVTIAPSDRLLGTHVFTAEADKNDPNVLRWSVVSLPVLARNAQKSDVDERASLRRKAVGAIPADTKPAPASNGPAEALDRITIPPETMARIAEALTTGASIVVSDQGVNHGETGEGTDFIVSLR